MTNPMRTRVKRRLMSAVGGYVYDVERWCDYDHIDERGKKMCWTISGERWRWVTTSLDFEEAKRYAIAASDGDETISVVFEWPVPVTSKDKDA